MPTPHAEAALRAMTLALGAAQPVLLSGPSGCGKTALLCELARRLGRGASMVKVHLDEQLDSKVLLGSYICSEAAGEFQWQPGVVTQAVAQGRWLLLEDVDRAPVEVMAALSSLLETRVLYVPGRAQALRAAPGFQIWGTLTTSDAATSGAAAAAIAARAVFAASRWQHVHLPRLPPADLVAVVRARYPRVAAAAPYVVRAFRAMVAASGGDYGRGGSSSGSEAAEAPEQLQQAAEAAEAAEELEVVVPAWAVEAEEAEAGAGAEAALQSARAAFGAGRHFSSRDLFKWCARLAATLEAGGLSLPA